MDPTAESMRSLVEEAVTAAGMAIPSQEMRDLAVHALMVYEANRTLSLTSVPVADAAVVHVVDSLRGMELMRRGGEGSWADLGSGAGFPGIPLCICGHRHVDLIESTRKKARFLDTVKAALCLDITVRDVRAEDAARETPEEYAAVSARAVGALSELVELASPLLRRAGVLVAWKGALTRAELRGGETAARIAGLARIDVVEYELPGTDARRGLVVFEKRASAAIALPRRSGLARRKPLA